MVQAIYEIIEFMIHNKTSPLIVDQASLSKLFEGFLILPSMNPSLARETTDNFIELDHEYQFSYPISLLDTIISRG